MILCPAPRWSFGPSQLQALELLELSFILFRVIVPTSPSSKRRIHSFSRWFTVMVINVLSWAGTRWCPPGLSMCPRGCFPNINQPRIVRVLESLSQLLKSILRCEI